MATVVQQFDMGSARLLTISGFAIPEYVNAAGTNFPVGGYAFDAAAIEAIYFQWRIVTYGSGNLTLDFDWYTNNTTGNALINAAIAAQTSGTDTTSTLAKSFATANTVTVASRTTANYPATGSLTISNLDSLANNDWVTLRLFRDATNGSDTLTTDAIITTLRCSYSDT